MTGHEPPTAALGDRARSSEAGSPAREADLRLMFENLGDGVYGMDRQGLCTFINRRALDLLGYDAPGDLVGRPIHDLIHHTRAAGSPYPAHDCPLMRTLSDGEPVLLDDELLWRRDGTSFYAEYASHPMAVGGAVVGSVVRFENLSARRQARQRLAVQQQVSQILGGEADVADAQKRVLATIGSGFGWDDGSLWLADASRADEVGVDPVASWSGAGASGDARAGGDHVRAQVVQAMRRGGTVAAGRHGGGSRRTLVAFPIRLGSDTLGAMAFDGRHGVDVDRVAEDAFATLGRQVGQFLKRRRAEAELRDSETRKAAIMQTALDGIVVIDADTRIVEFNPAAETTFGWSRDTALGQELGALILPADFLVGHLKTFARFLDNGEASAVGKHVEVEAVRSDGERFPAELAVTPFKAGGQAMFTAYMRDITERKRAEREVAAARDEAVEANRAKSQFLANMSHELRTPLSAIIGYAEMLQEEVQDGGDPASFAPDMAKVESNARHLLGLINDVLDLSKIESGRMEVFAEDFDVEAMVRDVASTVASLVEKKGNVLALDVHRGLGAMRTDLTKVKQMLLNLLSNASKFTEGGIIALSAERGPGTGGLDEVRFHVRDSGIGMTEEQMGRLFQRFAQAEASISSKFGGTGLGLSISKALAVMLGGDITVASAEGRGSTFTIVLPIAVPA